MRKHRSLKLAASLGLALSAALAGCGTLDELDRMEVEDYKKTCTTLGITPASSHYEQCLLQQQAIARAPHSTWCAVGSTR